MLSLDGYMAVDIDAGSLAAGDKVSVTVDEKTYPGTVDKLQSGKATVLLTDNGPAVDLCGQRAGCGRQYRRQRHALYPQPAHHRLRGRCLPQR